MTEQISQSITAMQPFARIIGTWRNKAHTELIHHVEWGVEQRIVNMHSHAPDGTLVSEGSWFWHPGEGAIKGVAVAVKMPVAFFDYTVKSFKGDVLEMALTAYNQAGEPAEHIETWTFTDDDHYTFTLQAKTPEGWAQIMAFGFERQA